MGKKKSFSTGSNRGRYSFIKVNLDGLLNNGKESPYTHLKMCTIILKKGVIWEKGSSSCRFKFNEKLTVTKGCFACNHLQFCKWMGTSLNQMLRCVQPLHHTTESNYLLYFLPLLILSNGSQLIPDQYLPTSKIVHSGNIYTTEISKGYRPRLFSANVTRQDFFLLFCFLSSKGCSAFTHIALLALHEPEHSEI